MLEGLHDAYDLCTPKGEELLHEAITWNQVQMADRHEVTREVLALRLYVEAFDAFDLAKGGIKDTHRIFGVPVGFQGSLNQCLAEIRAERKMMGVPKRSFPKRS